MHLTHVTPWGQHFLVVYKLGGHTEEQVVTPKALGKQGGLPALGAL